MPTGALGVVAVLSDAAGSVISGAARRDDRESDIVGLRDGAISAVCRRAQQELMKRCSRRFRAARHFLS